MKMRCSQMAAGAVMAVILACALPVHTARAGSLKELSDAFARVAEDVTPAVVSVISETERELPSQGAPGFLTTTPCSEIFSATCSDSRTGHGRANENKPCEGWDQE